MSNERTAWSIWLRTFGGTTGVTMIWECGCSSDVPAFGPWLRKIVISAWRGSSISAR